MRIEKCTAQQLIFEDKAHDFPKQLDYALQPSAAEPRVPTSAYKSENLQLRVAVSDGVAKGFTL